MQLWHFIMLLININSVSPGQSDQKSSDAGHSPFRVVWNIPDSTCGHLYDTLLRDNGIVFNTIRNKFVGDEIATIYNIGWWPKFRNNNISDPINSGLPQLANVSAHLAILRMNIASDIAEDAKGYGVFDQERWRVLYDLNYGHFTIYRHASKENVHISVGDELREKNAREEWEKYAIDLMVKSLQEAKSVRPNVKWGYYMYPQMWRNGPCTRCYNDRMAKLYEESTGLFPSTYIKNHQHFNYTMLHERNKNILSETIRVRAVHCRGNIPIGAYIYVLERVEDNLDLFNESMLDLAIGQAADMGLDSVIIWGSSNIFTNRNIACNTIKEYLHTILGPYVSTLIKKLTACSNSKCRGHGRCVKTEYVQSVPYILGKRIKRGRVYKANPNDLYKNYECQCYEGWIGRACARKN